MRISFHCASVATLAAAASLFGLAPRAGAAVLLADGFNDADRDNDGIVDAGTPAPVPSGVTDGVPFYVARNNSTTNINVSVVADATLGGGNSLQVTANSGRSVAATFATTTIADGGSISLAFDVRLAGTIPTADRAFRFGLYNNAATPVFSDTSGTTLTDDDFGYIVRLDTGTPSPTVAQISGSPAGTLLGGTLPGVGGSSDDVGYGLSSTAAHKANFTIARSGNTLNLSFQLDGLAPILGTSTVGDASYTTNTFNEIAFGTNVNALTFNIDNVSVTTTTAPIPEPASLSAVALAGGLLLRRRRR